MGHPDTNEKIANTTQCGVISTTAAQYDEKASSQGPELKVITEERK